MPAPSLPHSSRPLLPVTALCLLALAACQTALPAEDDAPAPASASDPILTLQVERAYTLEDPRDEDFKARIAAEAASACGSAGHRVMSTRPYGRESIGPEFLFRMYEVGILCTG